MNWLSCVHCALWALVANRLRSFLTMLGIIIGVGAVITMMAIGEGATQRVQAQMRSLGSNILLIVPGSTTAGGVRLGAQSSQSLTEDHALAIAKEIPQVQWAAPTSRFATQVVSSLANWNTTIMGITPAYLEVRDWPLQTGRLFESGELQTGAKVALIGQSVARELFGEVDPQNPQNVLGLSFRIKKVPFTVIGLLGIKGQNSLGQDQDDVVMVPLSTYRTRLQGSVAGKPRSVGAITVKVWEGQSLSQTQESISRLLRQRMRVGEGGAEPFTIRNLTELLQAQEASSQVMGFLLASVAGISLLIGGIGIMNIMLVSVTERTREIGLRRAVGARQKDILMQFLIEAVSLSLLGGLVGLGLGILAIAGMSQWSDWPVRITLSSVLLSMGFSGLVGIFFGFYPARKAANLRPIEALRFE
jgi:putative ABC transport system permease protein